MNKTMCNVKQLLCFLNEEYPQDLWISVCTDGSAQNAIKNGGAGVYIEYRNKTTEMIRVPTGTFCHNYDAEIQAIKVATEIEHQSWHTACGVSDRCKISTPSIIVQKIVGSTSTIVSTV
jgi:ribonuclease HI